MIEISNLSKKFSKHTVLSDLNLRIPEQERLALVGFNGAGKTTLIRCLLGEYLYKGTLKIRGLDPRQNRNEVLKIIGFVPQLPPPLKMTVAELFSFSASVCQSQISQIEDVANYLGLDLGVARVQPFNRLSGGQKQKVLISIALGRDSQLLILDEPAANLDPEARHLFFELLNKKKDTASMIISSHRLDEVASLVTRVVELDKGQIVLDDKVSGEDHLGKVFAVELTLYRPEEAVMSTLKSWSFQAKENSLTWAGSISGPDRLRFHGILSRYSGIISKVKIYEMD